MNKILVVGMGTCLMLSSLQSYASAEPLAEFEGRYAEDCSRAKALKESFIVGDQAMHRYQYGKGQRSAWTNTWQDTQAQVVENLNYHSSRQYGDYRVDFYESATKPWIKLQVRSGFMGWTKSTVLLPQCQA